MVCVRCGVWYPPGTTSCPEDNTPLVGPEAVTELAAELAEDTAVELGAGADDRICARCGERFPADTRRCPDDGTPLLLPDTLVELLEPSREHAPGSPPGGTAELTCVRCGRVFSGQVRRCPFDFTPLVQRALSSEQAPPPGEPAPKVRRRADEKTPLVTIVSDSTDEIPVPGGVSELDATALDEPTVDETALDPGPELDEPTLDDTRDSSAGPGPVELDGGGASAPPAPPAPPPPAPLEAPRPAPPAAARLVPAARPKPPSRPRVAPPPPGPLKMVPTETDEHEVEEAEAPEPQAALALAEGAVPPPRRGLSRRLALIGLAAAATLALAGAVAWLVGYLSTRGSKPPVLITTPEPEPRIRVTAAPVEDDAGSDADLVDAGR